MASNLWLSYAFLTASVYATLSLLDKVVLDNEMTRPFRMTMINNLPKFITFLLIGVVTGNAGISSGLDSGRAIGPFLLGASIGVVNVYSRLIYYKGLEEADISRFVPLINTDIVFVLLMGAAFLGEVFALPVYFGILVIFMGTMLLSLEDLSEGFQFISRRALVFGLLAGFTIGLISVQMKFLTPVMDLYAILFWFGVGGIFSLLGHGVYRQIRGTLDWTDVSVISSGNVSLMVSGVGSAVGYIPLAWALELGPASIVTAIANLQILLVFFGVIVLTRFTPEVLYESMDRLELTQKFTGSMLMLVGVVIIQIFS